MASQHLQNLRRPLAGTSGLLEDAPSARRLPDLRHRGGNDQAHTDAVAWFALFEMLPVLRERAGERLPQIRGQKEGEGRPADLRLDCAAKSTRLMSCGASSGRARLDTRDRKSTRLNSSHLGIS